MGQGGGGPRGGVAVESWAIVGRAPGLHSRPTHSPNSACTHPPLPAHAPIHPRMHTTLRRITPRHLLCFAAAAAKGLALQSEHSPREQWPLLLYKSSSLQAALVGAAALGEGTPHGSAGERWGRGGVQVWGWVVAGAVALVRPRPAAPLVSAE